MKSFPAEIVESIQKLRKFYKGKKSLVISNYPNIEIVKITPQEEISLKLLFHPSDGLLEILPPDHQYHSKISHYDYNKTERRWCRNKKLLFNFIADLKRCGIWDIVVNKDLFIINSFNEKVDSQKITKILDNILNKEYRSL